MTTPAPAPVERAPETPQEWARRVLAEHGPPPQSLVDHVTRLRRRHTPKATPSRERTA